ncbi:MAG: helix-turn-helix domain-containing protein [Lentisphaerae bacterium]|nr:helix-turn-helix domain-containing protein [Lentisphaerota bacterium]
MSNDSAPGLIRDLVSYMASNRITQKKLAGDFEVTQPTVCRWLSGSAQVSKKYQKKILKYINEEYAPNIKVAKIRYDNWPLREQQIQDVIDFYSEQENHEELFRLLSQVAHKKNK